MKAKCIGILLVAFLTLIGCDNNTATLGIDALLELSTRSGDAAIFNVTSRSANAANVYSKANIGYLGKLNNETGYFESSFIGELRCKDNFTFPGVYQENSNGTRATGIMAGDSVVSTRLVLYYSSWLGDSLSACRMSVYELNDEWLTDRTEPNRYRYSHFDASKYYNASDLLGRRAYTAYDASVPDSVRQATDDCESCITFRLDNARGNEILKAARELENGFPDAEYFINHVFRGIYAKNDFGDGLVLCINRVDLQMQFRFHYVDEDTGLALKKTTNDPHGKAGSDSLYSERIVLASTQSILP